jgi:hypothetical protein
MDEDTIVTSNLGAFSPNNTWLPFGGNTTIRVWFPPSFGTRTVLHVLPQVGTDPTPNGGDEFMPGDNWIYSVGQLAYFNFLQTGVEFVNSHGAFVAPDADGAIAVGGGFSMANATCADYFARFEVDFVPEESDAGTETPAGSLDASDLDAADLDAAIVDAAAADASTVDASAVDASIEADAGTE